MPLFAFYHGIRMDAYVVERNAEQNAEGSEVKETERVENYNFSANLLSKMAGYVLL